MDGPIALHALRIGGLLVTDAKPYEAECKPGCLSDESCGASERCGKCPRLATVQLEGSVLGVPLGLGLSLLLPHATREPITKAEARRMRVMPPGRRGPRAVANVLHDL